MKKWVVLLVMAFFVLAACDNESSSVSSRDNEKPVDEFSSSSEESTVRENLSSAADTSIESSSATSSSSLAEAIPPCNVDGKDSCEYGTLTDSRDGQTYKTVKIGDLVWMAQNLNYAYLKAAEGQDSSSWVYRDTTDDWCEKGGAGTCDKYGRLYLWSAAMDSVCPKGWHLPSNEEWAAMFMGVAGSGVEKYVDFEWIEAGTALRTTGGWKTTIDDGLDSYGFSVLPAGFRNDDGLFTYAGESAIFWSSTEKSSKDSFIWVFYRDYTYVYQDEKPKNYAYSVRCVKD